MVVRLEEAVNLTPAEVGGKAIWLARLLAAGVSIPAGFVIKTGAYRCHLLENNLRQQSESLIRSAGQNQEGDWQTPLLELREQIATAPIGEETRGAIIRAYRQLSAAITSGSLAEVAVRSSATTEDTAEFSFAGLHDTFLCISDIGACLDGVRQCWASLWSDRAFAFRHQQGIDHQHAQMAVIVQRFVRAESAGVVFTADPVSGNRNQLVIEAVHGGGESLVAGKSVPDRITLSRPGLDLVSRQPGGSSQVNNSEPSPLELDEAVELAGIALAIEELAGVPIDIEWARAAGRFQLLQARPITAMGAPADSEDRQVWTNANTGEVVPDVLTPMTWSTVRPVVDMLIGGFFARAGIDISGPPLIGLVAGRAYFNLNTVFAGARLIPGLRRTDIAELFGGRQTESLLNEFGFSGADLPRFRASRLRQLLSLPRAIHNFLGYSATSGNHTIDEIRAKADKLASTAFCRGSDTALINRITAEIHDILATVDSAQVLGMSVAFQGLFYRYCNLWFGADGNQVASSLLVGTQANENADAGFALWRLAQTARRSERVGAALVAGQGYTKTREAISRLPDGPEFIDQWALFMSVHGHHGPTELELANPRWSEQPDVVLDQLRSYLAAGPDNRFARNSHLEDSSFHQLAAEQSARLRNPLKRLAFKFLLGKARGCGSLRDSLRNQMVRRLTMVRQMLLELGRRLEQRGVLPEAADIFMLEWTELESLADPAFSSRLGELTAARRAEYEFNCSQTPPPVVFGKYVSGTAAEQQRNDTSLLQGIAVNPGTVRGVARVLAGPADGVVLPGEILVAPFTDPGWTPLFINAAAIVTDIGGILSHGSIIAREYGIPAVANTGQATRLISTGQLIEVDGGAGTVRLLD